MLIEANRAIYKRIMALLVIYRAKTSMMNIEKMKNLRGYCLISYESGREDD